MSIAAIGGSVPITKAEPETAVKSAETSRVDNKFVDRSVAQPSGNDQRIEGQIAVVRQQVSGASDTASSNTQTLKKPKLSSDLEYALTKLAIQGEGSLDSESEDSSSEDSEEGSRKDSQVIPDEVNKPKIQF